MEVTPYRYIPGVYRYRQLGQFLLEPLSEHVDLEA